MSNDRHHAAVLAAAITSSAATAAGYVALLAIGAGLPHAAWSIGALLVGDCVAPLVAGAKIGALADRLGPRRALAVGAGAQAAAFVAMAGSAALWMLLVFAVCAGAGAAMISTALLAEAAADERQVTLTARVTACGQVGMIAGPLGAAGVLLVGGSPRVVLVIGAVLLGGCAAVGRRLGGPARSAGAPADGEDVSRRGWRTLMRLPAVAAVVGCAGAASLAGAMINVAEPLLAEGLHAGSSGFAAMVAVYAAGYVGGALATGGLGTRGGRALRRAITGGLVAQAGGLAASAAAPGIWWALAAFVVTGAGNGVAVAAGRALIAASVPDGSYGSAFALSYAVNSAAFAVALPTAALLAGFGGPRLVFACAAGGMLAAAAVAALVLLRRRR